MPKRKKYGNHKHHLSVTTLNGWHRGGLYIFKCSKCPKVYQVQRSKFWSGSDV